MATIDNYSFICVENERMRFARPNDMNDPKRKIIIVGTLCGSQNDKTLQIIVVERYEKTYIIGKYRSFNSIYFKKDIFKSPKKLMKNAIDHTINQTIYKNPSLIIQISTAYNIYLILLPNK